MQLSGYARQGIDASLQMTMDLYCHVTEDTLFNAMKLMEKK